MKERTRLYTFLSLLFLLLLAVSGSFSGLPSILLYISAFLLPTAIGLHLIKREEGIVNLPMKKVKNVRLILPIVCPALLLIFLISYPAKSFSKIIPKIILRKILLPQRR